MNAVSFHKAGRFYESQSWSTTPCQMSTTEMQGIHRTRHECELTACNTIRKVCTPRTADPRILAPIS
jgi:hypothetical protein